MRSYLDGFMRECGYREDAICYLLDAYDKLSSDGNTLQGLIMEYEADYTVSFESMLNKVRELSERVGVHVYTADLVLAICFTRGLKKHYINAGISLDIWKNSVLDLRYKLDECICVKGIIGSFVARWFSGFFDLTRFALGRLQFEIVSFGAEYETEGLRLSHDSKLINVHIPRTGARLDRESTLESYRLAKEFFLPKLGDNPVFVCSSWLLFPRHKQMLRPGSNLISFIGDYTLIASGEYADYGEVWRLFDTAYDGDPTHLPADSSLRRSYLELIKDGEKTGWGKGIFTFNSLKE